MNKYETPEGVKTHDHTILQEFDADGFPDDLDEVIELLTSHRAQYPNYGLQLEVRNGCYDGDGPAIILSAWVPRPSAVVEAEQNRYARRKQNEVIAREQEERTQLRKLIEKYGVPNA